MMGYLKLKDVLAIFPVSRSTWYQGMQEGIYPRPVKLTNKRAVGWRKSDIEALCSGGGQ
jgi:prophage regulatory protein